MSKRVSRSGEPGIAPFEKYARRYDGWFEVHRIAYESELAALRELVPVRGRGLEIGVGSGRFAAPLSILMGIEPSMEMAKIARGRGVELVRGVAEAIPFGDSLFDHALMVTTICFVRDIDSAFKEVFRILKPGGAFVNGFIDGESPLGKLYQKSREDNPFYGGANFLGATDVISHLERMGFEAVQPRQTLFRRPGQTEMVEKSTEGYGKGSFVVVKARRPRER